MKTKTHCAKVVAPEDIQPGDYLVVLHTTYELTPMLIGCESFSAPPRAAPVTLMSWDTEPKKVLGVCLPIVLIVEPDGDKATLDTRRHQLARVAPHFGRAAFRKKGEDDKVEKSSRKKRRKR